MTRPPSQRPYEVGYGKPPTATQFGKRPQPARKKKDKVDVGATITAVLNEKATVFRNGKTERAHALEVQLIALGKRALNGEIRATRRFLQACIKAKVLEKASAPQSGGVLVKPKGMTMDLFIFLMSIIPTRPPWDREICDAIIRDYESDMAVIKTMMQKHERRNK